MHQINLGLIEAYWRVVGRGPGDVEQFALALKTQIGVFFTDHHAAFPLSSILRIDCRAVDGLIDLALVIKNHFQPRVGRFWREVL